MFCFAVHALAVTWPKTPKKSQENPFGVFYDQGFRFATSDGKFALRINGLLQVRYTYVDYDPMIRFNQEDYSNFFVRRARLYFTGNAGSPRFTYFIHVQLEPNQGLNANDLWIEYEFSDLLRLGAGRNKISYGLEFMNSGSALGMVERSLMYGETDIDLGSVTTQGPRYPGGGTERFGLSWYAYTGFRDRRDDPLPVPGGAAQGQKGSDSTPTFEYQVGIWQGRSTTSLSNGGNGHLLAARVGYHPWGFVDWRVVGDVDHTPHFKLGVIGSIYTNSSETPYAFDESGYNLAAIARYRGWSVDVEWGTESYDFDDFADDFDREGWRVAVGWYVVPQKLELRVRARRDHPARRPDLPDGKRIGPRDRAGAGRRGVGTGDRGRDLRDLGCGELFALRVAQQAGARCLASRAVVCRRPRCHHQRDPDPDRQRPPTRSTTAFASWCNSSSEF